MTPEEEARQLIDELLEDAGWQVHSAQKTKRKAIDKSKERKKATA